MNIFDIEMNSGGENVIHFVRCLKCQKILKCSSLDTEVLLDHIRTDHPEIEIVENTEEKMLSSQQRNKYRDNKDCYNGSDEDNNIPEPKSSKSNKLDTKVVYARRYKIKSVPHKSTLYKASIEKWQPATGRIFCPKCGANMRPIIRTRTERFAYDSCGACCILGCWPFCFLPGVFSGQNFEYLHCANCKTFLGLYDRACNCIKPNKYYAYCRQSLQPNRMKRPRIDNATTKIMNRENPEMPMSKAAYKADKTTVTNVGATSQDTSKTDPKTYPNDPKIPVITIDGVQVDPEQVKRLSKYSKWAGVDIKTLTEGNKSTKKLQ